MIHKKQYRKLMDENRGEQIIDALVENLRAVVGYQVSKKEIIGALWDTNPLIYWEEKMPFGYISPERAKRLFDYIHEGQSMHL